MGIRRDYRGRALVYQYRAASKLHSRFVVILMDFAHPNFEIRVHAYVKYTLCFSGSAYGEMTSRESIFLRSRGHTPFNNVATCNYRRGCQYWSRR